MGNPISCNMKQVIFLIFILSVKSFSQSIDIGDFGEIMNTYVDKEKKELYVIYSDSLSIIDLVTLKEKTKTKISYPERDFNLKFPIVDIDSELFFISTYGGLVFKLEMDKIHRVDDSFNHKMQINSTIFTHQDTIYKYGGYGFWSHRNFFTYYNPTTRDWKVIPPTGSTSLPKGSQNSIISTDKDNVYVYGGISSDEFNPLNYKENNEVWKFNTSSKSWDHMGDIEFNPWDLEYPIKYKNNHIFFDRNDKFFLVDIVNNQLKTYRKIPLQEKIISNFDPFYLNGIFYCFVLKRGSDNKIELIKIDEDLFLSELIKEDRFYFNNERIYNTLYILLSGVVLFFVFIKIKTRIQKRNKILVKDSRVTYHGKELNFEDKSIKILNLLLRNKEGVLSSEVLDIVEVKELNYGHNTRVKNKLIDEMNFKLKSILEIDEDLISVEKSKSDKRIKIYTINKSFFLFK